MFHNKTSCWLYLWCFDQALPNIARKRCSRRTNTRSVRRSRYRATILPSGVGAFMQLRHSIPDLQGCKIAHFPGKSPLAGLPFSIASAFPALQWSALPRRDRRTDHIANHIAGDD